MTRKEIREIAEELEMSGNPYREKGIRYMFGSETRYIWCGASYTEDEIREAYIETACHDIEMGYKERLIGYYDKWYRYCHADSGRAYDAGVKKACMTSKCPEEMHIIECEH